MNRVKTFEFLTHAECDKIVETILSLEDSVKSIGPDIYAGTSDDSLTGRFHCFNFLTVETINSIIAPKLKKMFGPCTVQCWANTFRYGEGINTHFHIDDINRCPEFVAAANIFLRGDPTTGTYYDGVKHINKVGEVSIFSPVLPHSVPKNLTNTIRISMALDIYVGSDKFMKNLCAKEPGRYVFIE